MIARAFHSPKQIIVHIPPVHLLLDFTYVIIHVQDFEARKRINQPVALKVSTTLSLGLTTGTPVSTRRDLYSAFNRYI